MLWRVVEMCFLCYFRVQEVMGGEQRDTGRIPRTVECHLTSDLCDSCVPGDTVTVTGIVRVTNDGTNTLKHTLLESVVAGSWWSINLFYFYDYIIWVWTVKLCSGAKILDWNWIRSALPLLSQFFGTSTNTYLFLCRYFPREEGSVYVPPLPWSHFSQ